MRSKFIHATLLGLLLVLYSCATGEEQAAPEAAPQVEPESRSESGSKQADEPVIDVVEVEPAPSVAISKAPSASPQLTQTVAAMTPEQRNQPNPLEADVEAADRGQRDYQTVCSSCHGPEGAGDGPAAEHIAVAPADLRSSELRAGERFVILRDGVPGTAMQSFAAAMSERQMWGLVSYMESFRTVSARPQAPQPTGDMPGDEGG